MLAKLKQQSLHKAIRHIAACLSARPAIPIHSGIKVQANKDGLTLTARNTVMILQYKIPVDDDILMVERTGNAVVPARYFMDIIRSMPGDIVTLEAVDKLNVRIRSGQAIYRLSTMDSEDYPDIDPIDKQDYIRIENDCFKKMVKQVSFAASSSESRMVLTGVLFQTDGLRLRLVATDGTRFASSTSEINSTIVGMFPPAVIPAKNLYDYSKMLSDASGETEIAIGNHSIRFTTDNFMMQSSLIQGIYPSVDKLAPNTFSSEITLDTSDFLHALERVSLLSCDTKGVGLRISSTGTELFARATDIGDVTEAITFEEPIFEPITISFNGQYMRDILRAIDSKHVQFKFTGKDKPIVIQPMDEKNTLYIIAPVRTSS